MLKSKEEFKIALVKPSLKKQSLVPKKNELKNYRPVSNLAFLSKVIEKVVVQQLKDFLVSCDDIEKFQSAYRAGHSTETALLRVQNDILTAIDNGKSACLILLDLSAAFDTIDHDLLLSFMQFKLGITGTVIEWFKSYLSDRSQKVVLDTVSSPPSNLAYGVPQGSVLGPFLFCVYLLPLSQIIKKHGLHFHIYADDTQLYYFFNAKSDTDFELAKSKIEKCVCDIQNWMTSVRLKLNEDKTEFLVITSPNYKQTGVTINIGQEIIKCSKSCRNLGVIFDTNLDFKARVSDICKSSYFHLRNIGAIRKFLSKGACEKLIHSLITNKLDYCNSLLPNLQKTQLYRLQKVQNVAARVLMLTRKRDHITPVIMELHWLPVVLRIAYKILMLVYKSLNNLGPEYLEELLPYYCPPESLRSASQQFLKPATYKLETYGKRAFCYVAPNYWNTLPLDLRHSDSLPLFKKNLKTFLFNVFLQAPEDYVHCHVRYNEKL